MFVTNHFDCINYSPVPSHVLYAMCRFALTLGLAAATLAAALAGPQRVVDRYAVRFAVPADAVANATDIPVGAPRPPTGPYCGNGDVTVMYTGNSSVAKAKNVRLVLDWQQWLYLSKNDMWGSDSTSYYPHLSAGRIGILASPARTPARPHASHDRPAPRCRRSRHGSVAPRLCRRDAAFLHDSPTTH